MTENPNERPDMVEIPVELMDCLAYFIHQLEINDYTTKDGIHDLKMNAYWPAVHGLYVSMVQNRYNFDNKDILQVVKKLNDDRTYLLAPTFTPSNEQEVQFKSWIDAQSYQGLLQRWRFSKPGDLIFIGPIGDYYKARLTYMRDLEPDNGVRASKNIGWDP